MKRFLFILVVFCARCFGSATNVYVTPSGTATGACPSGTASAPNLTPSGFSNASNWGAGTGQIAAGTTVLVCGTFTAPAGTSAYLEFQGAGTSGNLITMTFDTGTVIQAPYWSGAIISSGNSPAWITIDGANATLQATANGTNLANQQDGGIGVQMSGCSHCTLIDFAGISNLYVHACTLPVTNCTDEGGQSTYGILWDGGSYATIAGNTVNDAKWCSAYEYGAGGTTDTNFLEFSNTFSDCDHGIVVGDATTGSILSGSNCSNAVYWNDISNMGNWDDASGLNHHDGIHSWANGGPASHYYDCVYSNYIHGAWGVGTNAGILFESDEINAMAFNNVMVPASGACAAGMIAAETGTGSGGSGLLIANNTAIGNSTTGGTNVCSSAYGVQSSSSVTMKNNIASNIETYVYAPTASTFAAVDYNLYATPAGTNPFYGPCGNGVNFVAWQATTCSFDTHGANETVTLNSVPYTLPFGSAAIGFGTNLTSLGVTALQTGPPQTFGATGSCGTGCLVRSSTLAWDAGAYPYTGAVVTPPPLPWPWGLLL